MKKKWFVFALCGMMLFAMTACSSTKEESTTGMPNPMTEVSYQELLEKTGVDMPAPEGATDVKYFTIKIDDNATMAQMDFTLDGKKATLRAQSTGLTTFDNTVKDLVSGKVDVKAVTDSEFNISGLNYEWKDFAEQKVAERTAVSFLNGDVGFIAWVDVVPGFVYNLGMNEGASHQVLTDLANKVFVPIQKNVG